jgi:hypothetical protein
MRMMDNGQKLHPVECHYDLRSVIKKIFLNCCLKAEIHNNEFASIFSAIEVQNESIKSGYSKALYLISYSGVF